MSTKYLHSIVKAHAPTVLLSIARDFREAFRRIFSLKYYHNSVDSSSRIEEAILGGRVWIGEHCKITGDVRIGKYTTLNSGCLLFGKITIGNYCQFGPRVSIYTANHAVNYLTTYNSEALFGGALKQLVEPKQVDIGHDVWLGHGSVIMPGVSLGTGCIVGAGSVVTKAVAPYAIVGGSPARLIRFRLSEPHLERILNSHWWCLDPEELDEFRDVFTELPNKIAESRLEKLSRLGTAKARSMKAGESR